MDERTDEVTSARYICQKQICQFVPVNLKEFGKCNVDNNCFRITFIYVLRITSGKIICFASTQNYKVVQVSYKKDNFLLSLDPVMCWYMILLRTKNQNSRLNF